MEKIVVTYGNGDPKKGSVRVKPISVEDDAVPVISLGDYYVARGILGALGLKDADSIKITFEKA
jgi:hypothetical protein